MFKCGLLLNIRKISTSSAQKAEQAIASTTLRDNYYQKIGKKDANNDENFKPEGWDEAKPFEEIPGYRPLPLIGNNWRFLPGGEFYNLSPIDLHLKINKKCGNLAMLDGLLGKKPMILSYDPNDIEKVLRNEGTWPIREGLESLNYYRTEERKDIFHGVVGLTTSQGEDWFNFRSIVNKILMQPRVIEMYLDRMDSVTNDLLDNMKYFAKTDPNNEMPDDFQNELHKWSLESIGLIAFNKRLGCLAINLDPNSEVQKIIDSVLGMFDAIYKLDILPSMWKIYKTKTLKKLISHLDYLTQVNTKFIDECLANSNPDPNIPEHERSILERLIKVNKKVALAMTLDLTNAGIDTTGKTLAATLYYLGKNPKVQENLRKELLLHMPNKDSPVTSEMLKDCPYVKAVIKETTRLAPIAIGNLRTTVKNMVLSEYQVPKGVHEKF
ncbi:hypothetical protein ABEB36_007202 [Hypothenemus hampei]|uniref:Cytochrome P450 n=1 Tax=Hypothenemus hampei TaxID=57062 RepID=A0ABD1ETB9_HYPHA